MAEQNKPTANDPARPDQADDVTQPHVTPVGSSTVDTPPKLPRDHLQEWPVIARYEVLELIARGGMGAVYKARDVSLKREVAVKVIHDRYKDSTHARRRFEYEATITAQLQHPSIPPVHDLGTAANGSPYLALKLIKGQTLDDQLKSRPDATTDQSRFVAIFEAICQAVGYAHSKGVLHRDLKPLNVMVGAFGEVQVMDWGLAKFRGDAAERATEATAATTFHDPRTADDSQTGAGSVIGTPAYMPPEQAIGAVDLIDERSDVFGLGAILCVILTGRPPFVGKDAEATRQLAARGKVDDAMARLEQCRAEPGLVALAKRCLAVDPVGRPMNGSAVAEEVARLRADADRRVRVAEVARTTAEARRRVLTRAAAAVVVALSIGIAASTWLAIRATEAEWKTGEQLKKTQAAEQHATAKTREVQDTLAVVEERTRLALDTYNQMVFEIQNKLENRPGTQELRRELLALARTGLTTILAEARKQGSADQTIVWCHLRMGDVELGLGNAAAARNEYEAAHVLAKRWADADPKDSHAARDLCVSYEKLGRVAILLGRTTEALGIYRTAVALNRRLAEAEPANPLLQRDLGMGYERLGDVLLRLEELTEGREAYEKSLAVYQAVAIANPTSPLADRDLSAAYLRLGSVALRMDRLSEANEYNQKGLALARRIAAANTNDTEAKSHLAWAIESSGMCYERMNRDQDAYEQYQQAFAIRKQLADADPRDVILQRDVAAAWEHLGDVALKLGRPTETFDSYRQALAVRERLADHDPTNTDEQRELGTTHERMGDAALQTGHTNDARASYQLYVAIVRRLLAADEKSFDMQRALSWALKKLGMAEQRAANYSAAIRYFEEARAVAKCSNRPELLHDDIAELQQRIDDCRSNRQTLGDREPAPPPRPASER